MPEEMDCKDGFCQMRKPYKEVKAGDILFAPIEDELQHENPKESAQAEDSKMRQRFLQYCDEHPYDVECKIYDV